VPRIFALQLSELPQLSKLPFPLRNQTRIIRL
jgi:hypothetical protein